MPLAIDPIRHPEVYDNPGYHQALQVTGLTSIIMVSGQVAVDREGNTIHVGDFSGQARATLNSIKRLVEEAGSSLNKIIKMDVFVSDINCRPEFARIREEIFGRKLPPMSMVEVSALVRSDWQIEVDAIAVK